MLAKNDQDLGLVVLAWRQVRFDGDHKGSDFLADIPGSFVEFVPVSPEVKIGFGVPLAAYSSCADGHRAWPPTIAASPVSTACR
jgi:hypothetical protein